MRSVHLLAILALCAFSAVGAADIEWQGDVTPDWGTGGNWNGDSAPGTGDRAVFNTTYVTSAAANLATGQSVGRLQFDHTGITITGSNTALTLTVSGGTNPDIEVVSGTHTMSCSVTLSGATTIQVAAGCTLTMSGAIGGSGGITKTGTGTLVLSGINAFTGTTTISAGTLKVGGGTPLASTAVAVAVGGTLDLNGNNLTVAGLSDAGTVTNTSGTGATLTVTGGTSFSGSITNGTSSVGLALTGTADLTLSTTQTFTGGTTIGNGCFLRLGATNVLPSSATITVNGTLDLKGNSLLLNNLAGTGTVTTSTTSSTLTINSDSSFTYGGAITGAVALTKLGTGTLTLSGTNTFTGDTTVSTGVLRVGGGTPLTNTAVEVAAAGTLNLNGINLTIAELSGAGTVTNSSATAAVLTINGAATTTFTGQIANGTSTVGLTLAGTTNLTLDVVQTYGGGTTIGSGCILQINDVNALLSSGSVAVNGTLDLQGNNLQVGGLSGTGTVTSTSGTLTVTSGGTFAGVIADGLGLTKLGAGTLTLTGTSTYTGATTVGAGTLLLGVANALPVGTALTVTGSFDLNGKNQTIASLSGTGPITTSSTAAVLTINGSATTVFAGAIGTSLGLTLSGNANLTLSAAQTYTGTTTIDNGSTLKLGVASGLPATATATVNGTLNLQGNSLTLASLTGSGTVTSSGGTLTINNASDITFSGAITGALSLTKSGAGVLILSGSNTYTGATAVGAGTLQLGSANALPAGSALTVTGTLNLNAQSPTVASLTGAGPISGGTAVLTVNGSAATTYTGQIGANIGLTLAGTTNLSLSAAQASFNGAVVIGGACTLNLQGNSLTLGSLTGSGTLTSSSGTPTLTLSSGSNVTFDGVIAGSVALTKLGTGALTLTGVNTYSGATTITAGSLQLSGAGRLGSTAAGTTVGTGTSLILASNAGIPAGEALALNGTLSLDATTTSTTVGSAITLGGTTPTIDVGTGTLQLTGTIAIGTGLTLSGSGGGKLGGVISGPATMTVNGGAWELAGTNPLMTGTATVGSGAVLTVSGSCAAVTVNANARLTVTGTCTTVSVGSDGLLEGTGTCGAVTVNGGTIAPGVNTTRDAGTVIRNGVGALTVASLSLTGGASVDLDLGLASDLVACSGLLSASGTTTVNINGATGFTTTTYVLIDASTSSTAGSTFTTDQRTGLAVGSTAQAGMVGNDLAISVDNSPPTLSRITAVEGSGTYFAGNTIQVQLEFNEPVNLSGGSLNVTLNTQPSSIVVNIPAAAGYSTTLVASYTIAAPRYTFPAALNVTAIAPAGGAVVSDQFSNNIANLNTLFSGLLAANNLGLQRTIVIDNQAPQQVDAQVDALLNVPSIGSAISLNGKLAFTDLEMVDPDASLIYTIKLLSAAGTIERWDGNAWTALGLNGTFTRGELEDAGFYGSFAQAGRVRYQHTGATAGNDAFGFTVRDGQTPERTSALTAKSVTIVGNAQPVVPDQAIVLAPGLSVSGQLVATDPEGATLTFSYPDPVTEGVIVTTSTGSYTYTHNQFTGNNDVLRVSVSDGATAAVVRDIPILIYTSDTLTPRFTSAAPMRAERPLTTVSFSYPPTVTRAAGVTALSYRLSPAPQLLDGTALPADNPATPAVFEGYVFSSTTGAITWPAGAPAWGAVTGGYIRFGIVVLDADNKRAGYQPVLIRVAGDPG